MVHFDEIGWYISHEIGHWAHCSNGPHWLATCVPYDGIAGLGLINVKKNSSTFIGKMVSWSESNFKFIDIDIDQRNVQFPLFPIQEKVSIQWTLER